MESNEEILFGGDCLIYMKINVFLYVCINIHMFILLSSPYHLVFGDDLIHVGMSTGRVAPPYPTR